VCHRLGRAATDGVHVGIRKLEPATATSRTSPVDDCHDVGAAADWPKLPHCAPAGPHAAVHGRFHQDHLIWQTLGLKHLHAAVFAACTKQPMY